MLNFLKFKNRSLENQFALYGAGIPFLLLLPFAIYRFVIGDLMLASIDFGMAMFMAAVFIQSWRSKNIKILKYFAVISFMLGFLGVIHLKGPDMIFWAFPAMAATYFLLQARHAFIANILFIACTTLLFFDKLTKTEVISVYPSLILVCFFGFLFSMRSERQNKKFHKLATEDTLTGVENRRSFDDKVEEILAQYKRSPKPVSVLLLDIDYFKKINDSYGHKKGDQVLTDFAQKVKSIIRSTDHIYRFGGEEFVVIAENSSLENAGILGESIRGFIQTSPSISKYNITVSIGVSEIVATDDADSLFRRADKALYEAKSDGRNKVRLANFDKKEEVHPEALRKQGKIKPISSKKHSFILSQEDQKSKILAGYKKRVLNIMNIIDKV